MTRLIVIIIMSNVLGAILATCDEIADLSDFSVVSKSPYYVDKTLLIKDVFRDDSASAKVKVISAPSGFGKSTALDMIKKFAGIVLNDKDEPIVGPANETENYKLFCGRQPPFDICNDEAFVEKHMARYPIIRIDYGPLKQIEDYQSMLEKLRLIVLRTYADHTYLQFNQSLFLEPQAAVYFAQHCIESGVDQVDIEHSFVYLSRLLREHYGRPVVILQDEYDADYVGLSRCNNVSQVTPIANLLRGMRQLLFEYNDENLEKALIFGEIGMKQRTSLVPDNTEDCAFLDDRHSFSDYYFGLTENEIDRLVKNGLLKINNKTKEEQIKRDLLERYHDENHVTNGKRYKLYRTSSVMEYLRKITTR